jgi:hypothetical protein
VRFRVLLILVDGPRRAELRGRRPRSPDGVMRNPTTAWKHEKRCMMPEVGLVRKEAFVTDEIEVGPIDYLVVEWPAGKQPTGEALPLLVDLVERGLIRVLDLAFIRKDEDGTIVGLDLRDLALGWDPKLTVFEGASSGLIGDDDREEAGGVIEPGCSAALLVYENTWAAPFATAVRRGGAQLVATGRIPINAIIAALDEVEAEEA